MRTRLTLYNTVVSLISQFLFLILSIIFPRLIILIFGSEINGLTASVNQVLNIINLLQAGIVGASIYDMYRPVSEKNNKMIGEIYYSAKKYFDKLSIIFFVFGIVLIPFFLINSNNNISFIESFLSVVILTLNGAMIFKYISSYDIIISAHQRKYILVYSSLLEKIIYYLLLGIVLYTKVHFIFMYLALICGTFFRIAYLHFYFKKNYLSDIIEYSNNFDYKVKNQYYLLSNQIIQQLIESAPTLIISAFYGLAAVSVFSLYNMIVSAFKMIFTTIQNSIAPSFGDLSVTDKSKTSIIFDVIHLLFINLGEIVTSCLIVLCLPFINLYSKGFSDLKYINEPLSFCIAFLCLAYCIFMPYNMAINANGQYKAVTHKNFFYGSFFTLTGIGISFIDYSYSIIAFSAFYVISSFDRIYVIKKYCFSLNEKIHVRRIVISLIFPVLYYFFFNFFLINTWSEFILFGFLHFFISSILILLIDFAFDKNVIIFIIKLIRSKL
ncbi:hypothetical protein MKC73_15960 [[Clostridium] innocuum]|nr:hypothetical protein [[Clostridium] innocuum]